MTTSSLRMRRIEPPSWARSRETRIEDLPPETHDAIQRERDALLEFVHREVQEYIDDPGLCFPDTSFPNRTRLTGEYYIGGESYFVDPDACRVRISVKCRCLGGPKPGVPRDDDYLGLEVWLTCNLGRSPRFEVYRNTDSASI